MPEQQQKIVACVDRSRYSTEVADGATWAAQHLGAPLEFLHVIDRTSPSGGRADHSGAIGFDAQEHLLQTLADEDATRAREARELGRECLSRLRQRALAAGIEAVDMRLRHGDLRDTLVEQQRDARLFVLGRRGRSAEVTHRDLGRNLEAVVRALQRPILVVGDTFRAPRHALIAYDGGIVTRRGIEMLAGCDLLRGVSIDLLMVGDERSSAEEKKLDAARGKLQAAGFTVTASHLPGDAETVIAQVARERDIDLMVMGAYAHSPLRRLFLGSRTNQLLRAVQAPTLLLR